VLRARMAICVLSSLTHPHICKQPLNRYGSRAQGVTSFKVMAVRAEQGTGGRAAGRWQRAGREAGREAGRAGRGAGRTGQRGRGPGRPPKPPSPLQTEQLLAFERKGWVVQRGLFTAEEVAVHRYLPPTRASLVSVSPHPLSGDLGVLERSVGWCPSRSRVYPPVARSALRLA
jgi:hypothetical protein